MAHADLPDAGRTSHFEIDGQLPTLAEKAALPGAPGPPSGANRYLTENHAAGGFGGFANPTASVGLAVVNGVATTAMRSDGAPALDQAITPTWGGSHIFGLGLVVSAGQGITMADGVWIGQVAGPLITFDDTLNYLEITGCSVGIGTAVPGAQLDVEGTFELGVGGSAGGIVYSIGLVRVAGAMLYDNAGTALTLGGDSAGVDVAILADGSVGLNTLTPDTRLQVVGDLKVGDDDTNYVNIGAMGDVVFVGSATVWNDIYFPMSSGRIGGANQPTWAAFQGNTMEYLFAINDYIHLPTQEIAHSYKEGSDIKLHVHIVLDGSDVGDTDVNYEIEYTIGDEGETMSAAVVVTSGDYTITGGTADRTHIFIQVGTIVGTNLLIQAALKMRFRRIALVGGGNAPSNDPFVLMVGVHIEEDTVGSRAETTK